jgi:hypothetical protein
MADKKMTAEDFFVKVLAFIKTDADVAHAAQQMLGLLEQYTQAELDAAVSAERERCADIAYKAYNHFGCYLSLDENKIDLEEVLDFTSHVFEVCGGEEENNTTCSENVHKRMLQIEEKIFKEGE